MFKKALLLFSIIFLVLAARGYETPCDEGKMVFMKIATGSETGTYIKIGEDIKRFVAPDSCVVLKVESTRGSVINAKKLLKERYVALGIVQADVLGKYKELAQTAQTPKLRREARLIVDRLRVIKSLYMEEVHFIVRKDSLLKKIQDIRDAKINIGQRGSGTAMSTLLIYKELFQSPILMRNITTYGYEEALQKLINGEIDVVSIVGGQPLGILKNPPNWLRGKIRLLSYDKASRRQADSYLVVKIKKESYPWLDYDIDTLGVPSYLVTFDYGRSPNNYQRRMKKALARMAFNLHKNMPLLKKKGHEKWKEVNSSLEAPRSLPRGWKYYDVTKDGYEYEPGVCSQRARRLTLCQ
jgi:TRAP transporter TAXI family solute receptor